MSQTQDIYAQVTASIVAQIEAGAGTWKMPWQCIAEADAPVNATTRKAYRGGNHLMLSMVAAQHGYSGQWATYRQWQSVGAQVRRGERSTAGVKWSPMVDRRTEETRLVPFVFRVFAAEQVDGWEAPVQGPRGTLESIEGAEHFFSRLGARVVHRGNQAFYQPADDYIGLPAVGQFTNAVDYYATSAHEHAHWTGHASRLNRDLRNRLGSDAYSAEELVAELSSAFTCRHLGISMAPRPDHAAYLDSWLRVLRADCRALFAAASKAQSATDYLTDLAGTTTASDRQGMAA